MIFAVLLCYLSSSKRMGLSWTHITTSSHFGLIAQLVEHCTSITEVRVQVPSMPEFFRLLFCYCLLKSRSKAAKIINLKKRQNKKT